MVLERVWEAKILDFRTFFIIFRSKILSANWKGKKCKKKANKRARVIFFMVFRGMYGPGGKDYRMGGNLPKPEFQALP